MLSPDPTPSTALPTLGDPAPRPAPRAVMPVLPPPPPTEIPPGATASLVYGILSVVCSAFPLAGLVLGIAAIVAAGRARSAFLATPGRYLPSGAATGGLVMGIIGTVISVLLILFWITLVLILLTVIGAADSLMGGHHGAGTVPHIQRL